jgi:hypothetical protein
MDRPVPLAAPGGGALAGIPALERDRSRLVTRRRLLETGGAAFAALTLGEGVRLVQGARTAAGLRGLRRSDYEPYIGHRFGLAVPGGGALSAPLVAVEDFPGQSMRYLAGSQDAFILIFHALPGSPRLGQAVMRVTHPRGWTQRLLLSPAGPGRRGLDYATVINRSHPNSRSTHG